MDSSHDYACIQTVNDESYDDMFRDWIAEQENCYDAEDATIHHYM